jgi:hypothetical protein
MTPTRSTVLPRTIVASVAVAAAHRAKVVAGVSAALAAVCLLAGVTDVIRSAYSPDRNDAAAVFWVAVFATVAVFAVRRANRAQRAARRAAADPGATWTLVDKLVVAFDDRGHPAFDLSFAVTAAQRTVMLACPAGMDERVSPSEST